MFVINLAVIFAFGLVITAIVFKGMLDAQEFAKRSERVSVKAPAEDAVFKEKSEDRLQHIS